MKWNKVILKFVSISFSILVMLLVIVGLIELGTVCYDFGYRVFTESPVDEAPGKEVTVSVTPDMSEIDIGRMLEEQGLVRDSSLFFAQLKLSAYSGKLLPGEYTLNTSMTGKEMIVAMATAPEESTETEEEERSGAEAETEEPSGDATEHLEDAGKDAGETP